MPAKTHALTGFDDHIKGGAGRDIFLAGKTTEDYELNAGDRLDGGKGIDRIEALLAGDMGAPVMRRIERGTFTFDNGAIATLDLAHARQMRSVTFDGADNANTTTVTLEHASSVNAISALGGGTHDVYFVQDLDSVHRKTLSFTLVDTAALIVASTVNSKPFSQVNVKLSDGSDATLQGGALSAPNVTLISTGVDVNHLKYDPGMYAGTTRHLTIKGSADLYVTDTTSEIFDHLFSVDLRGHTAYTQLRVGGEKLVSVLGGAGESVVRLSELGGTQQHKAIVSLGAGNDGVILLEGVFDAATQRIDAGAGADILNIFGAVTDLWKGVKNFETTYLYDALGTYDVHNLTSSVFIYSTDGLVTMDRIRNGATLGLLGDFSTFMTVNVEGAAASQSESLSFRLTSDMTTFGNSVVGLSAPDLSVLRIQSFLHAHVMYLTTIGSETDGATIEISESGRLELRATTGSTSYIDTLTITNSGGADLSGLANANQAFVSTGATITGGSGDDVLLGGIGSDTIATGGGNNTVLGSFGADAVTLGAGGLDVLIFTAQGQSSVGVGHDTILNFGAFDAIDVSAIGDVIFAGNFADNASGIAALSTSQAKAFFNTTNDTLYLDLNHDKALGANLDMEIVLTGLSGFQSGNLIS